MPGTVTYRLSGRLGNQLQLWACARTISLRYGLEFAFRPFMADLAPLAGPTYPLVLDRRLVANAVARGRVRRLRGHDWDLSGNERGEVDPRLLRRGRLLVLDWSGIFTRVDGYRSVLISELLGDHPRPEPKDAVAVHYRQGDAAYPQPVSTYVNAIKRMGVGYGDSVTVFSDGPAEQMAASIGASTGARVDIAHESPMTDLLHMAAHRRLVLSQSWFSYWAAFLSDAEDIVAPPDFRYYPSWRTT